MPFTVLLTDDAARDLEEIYDYIAVNDSKGRAVNVLDKIEKTFWSLSSSPERGVYPQELQELGMRDYREVFLKPYRIIYRDIDESVFVVLIADGRRNMQTLLQRRLFEA
jgi:toxin ParE1/3/4